MSETCEQLLRRVQVRRVSQSGPAPWMPGSFAPAWFQGIIMDGAWEDENTRGAGYFGDEHWEWEQCTD